MDASSDSHVPMPDVERVCDVEELESSLSKLRFTRPRGYVDLVPKIKQTHSSIVLQPTLKVFLRAKTVE